MVDSKLADYLRLVSDAVTLEPSEGAASSTASGGFSGGGGMESRVAKLESDVEHLKRDVGELRSDMRDVRDRLTRIETRVDHLPSKGFVVTSAVVTITLLTAVTTFQDRIQQFVGVAIAAAPPTNP